MAFDNEKILEHFQKILSFKTVSYSDRAKIDYDEFFALHKYLEKTYPLVHKTMQRRVIGKASLLYHWKGTGEKGLGPVAFMAHLDVVPVGDEALWKYPPFSGTIADGYLWNRGVLDNKAQLLTQMEACEELISEGYTPPMDVYLCYGHNEELMASAGSESGAAQIVDTLKKEGVRLRFVIDEGGCVTDGSVMGIEPRIAVVGLAEKGYADIKLTVRDIGGHSSQPGPDTALSRLAHALVRLEENPMPQRLLESADDMFRHLAPHMSGAAGKLLKSPKTWWFILKGQLAKKRVTNALSRTTISATMASGAAASNILPEVATATLNARLLPGDTVEDVMAHVKGLVGDGVEVELLNGLNPSPESKTDGCYPVMEALIKKTWPDAVVSPYIMLAASDARMYYAVSDHVYRFAPVYADAQSMPTTHSVNERLPAGDNFKTGSEFYANLVKAFGEMQ